jgi:gliding motility-associated-like protein
MNSFLVKFFAFLITILSVNQLKAQGGREFWFAAPEVINKHADRPIFLRLSSYDRPANVTISMPANPNFKSIIITLPTNSLQSIDLTSQINLIESKPADVPLKNGLHIVSSSEISAYYEVLGESDRGLIDNSDIFVLKANAALGKSFYIPMQNYWSNNNQLDARSSFDIVATEDNTEISITPTKKLAGNHLKGIPFTIYLNKGETYSASAYYTNNDRGYIYQLASGHATASKVISNKPIAITYKDDSVVESIPNTSNSSWDLIGDQLVPIKNTGTEYIAIKTNYSNNVDRVFITPTEENTTLYVNNDSLLLKTDSTYKFQLIDSATYFKTTAPVYAFHVSGFTTELGGALLPPLKCTGSKSVAFVRSNYEQFGLTILAKSGSEADFSINGSNKIIPSNLFKTVAGTNGNWKFAQLIFKEGQTDIIDFEKQYIIKNASADFHLGIMNGGANTSFRYGYFSGFGEVDLPDHLFICEGDSIEIDAGQNKDSYLWNFKNESSPIITVKDTGIYWVEVKKSVCTFRDSTIVKFAEPISKSILGKDTSSCANVPIAITPLNDFSSYLWQNGNKTKSIIPSNSGDYILEVKNEFGCRRSDTINFKQLPIPKPEIIIQTTLEQFCTDSTIRLSVNQEFNSYLWQNGETTSSITTRKNATNEYSITVTNSNCTNSTLKKLDCSPFIYIPNIFTPNNDNVNDQFRIHNLDLTSWKLAIYNRWGKEVYNSEPYQNNWDGKGLPDGIYLYQLINTKEDKKLKGWVEILR